MMKLPFEKTMSQLNCCVDAGVTDVPETWPVLSLPYDTMTYAAGSAPTANLVPHASFCGMDLMYVGESAFARAAVLTPPMFGTVRPDSAYVFMSVARASHAVATLRMSAIVRF